MKGADLKCWICGGSAIDVAPDIELDVLPSWAVQWTCGAGHKAITGMRGEPGKETLQTMPIKEKR